MEFGFDRVIDRHHTCSAKFDTALQRGYPADVLPMWTADMDFQAPPCVLETVKNAVDHGIFGYSILDDEYYAAVENWFSKRFDWQVSRDWMMTTPGVIFALSAGVRAATQPGDAVLIQPPVYGPFFSVIEENNRKLVESPLIYADGKYTVDFEDMEEKIREHAVKLFILCSPHNPACRVWTAEELEKLGAICKQYGVTVISDEIHCDFAFPEYPHTPFIKACPDMAEHTIVCTAPSKSFNMAGLQISNIFIPGQQLREAFQRELDICAYHGPNLMGIIACKAAYQGAEAWLDACKVYMRENLEYVRSFLKENIPQIHLVEPEGTYLAWLDCTGLGMTKEELDHALIHEGRLWLASGSVFGECVALFQRMVLACPRETVVEAMGRLKKAVEKKRGQQ